MDDCDVDDIQRKLDVAIAVAGEAGFGKAKSLMWLFTLLFLPLGFRGA
jgi:hypothetical protein